MTRPLTPTTSPVQTSWLLIDQASHFSGWGFANYSDGLIVASDDILLLSKSMDVGARQVKLLLLLVDPEQRLPIDDLPPAATTFIRETRLNAWCHYGANIAPAGANGPTERWIKWKGLDEASKECVFRANGGKAPFPFSKGQMLEWSKQINTVKQLISRSARDESRKLHKTWAELDKNLQIAWAKADEKSSRHVLTNIASHALSFFLNTESIEAALKAGKGNSSELALILLGQNGSGGLLHIYTLEDRLRIFRSILNMSTPPSVITDYEIIYRSIQDLRDIVRNTPHDTTLRETLENFGRSLAAIRQHCLVLSGRATELLQNHNID